ncbi:MAG: hypothetical protein HC945_01165 [Nitrosarchaeum sp.]|nr:hypothetical protein [Nitrosarchaeum sp.]
MISCGVRESIAYLCRKRLVDVIVTTAGGVEEDVMKVQRPFVIGEFDPPARPLFDSGVNRTGNTYIPSDRYLVFERFFNPLRAGCLVC